MVFYFFVTPGFGDLFLDWFVTVNFFFLPENKSNTITASLGFCEIWNGGQTYVTQKRIFRRNEKKLLIREVY